MFLESEVIPSNAGGRPVIIPIRHILLLLALSPSSALYRSLMWFEYSTVIKFNY